MTLAEALRHTIVPAGVERRPASNWNGTSVEDTSSSKVQYAFAPPTVEAELEWGSDSLMLIDEVGKGFALLLDRNRNLQRQIGELEQLHQKDVAELQDALAAAERRATDAEKLAVLAVERAAQLQHKIQNAFGPGSGLQESLRIAAI